MKSAAELGSEPMTKHFVPHVKGSRFCAIFFCDFKSFCPIIISKGNMLTKFFCCNAQTIMCSANHSILNCMLIINLGNKTNQKIVFNIYRNSMFGVFFYIKEYSNC